MPTYNSRGFPLYGTGEDFPGWAAAFNSQSNLLATALDISDAANQDDDTVALIADIPTSGNWVGRQLYVQEDESIRLCTALPGTYEVIGYAGGWSAYTPVWNASTTDPTVASYTGRYRKVGKKCDFRMEFVMGGSAGSGIYDFSLPFTAHADGRQTAAAWIVISGFQYYSGVGMIDAGGSTVGYVNGNFGAEGAILQNSNPSWTTGSSIAISGTYETA